MGGRHPTTVADLVVAAAARIERGELRALERDRPLCHAQAFDPADGPGPGVLMETRTHLFTFPIETDSERAATEEALEKLSSEQLFLPRSVP
jgi:hypothetical protein